MHWDRRLTVWKRPARALTVGGSLEWGINGIAKVYLTSVGWIHGKRTASLGAKSAWTPTGSKDGIFRQAPRCRHALASISDISISFQLCLRHTSSV